jgi:PilZ domain
LPNLHAEAQLVGTERRKTPRYPFKAFAELLKEGAGAAVTTQISELSLHGCFIEKTNPFPVGLSFHIKIFTEKEFFESSATVVYSQPDQGMGVVFHEIRPAYVNVLRKWLLDAMMMKKPGSPPSAPRVPSP